MDNKNSNDKKSFDLSMMLIALLLIISIGFAVVSTTLKISGNAGISRMSWDIHFNNVVQSSTTNVVPVLPATILNEGTKIQFDVSFTFPNDVYEFDVDIVNAGTIDAMINSVVKAGVNPEQADLLIYEVSYKNGDDIQVNDLLKAGRTKTIHVKVMLNSVPIEHQNFSLTYDIDYIQANENAVERG